MNDGKMTVALAVRRPGSHPGACDANRRPDAKQSHPDPNEPEKGIP
jgi:hypothetical protein